MNLPRVIDTVTVCPVILKLPRNFLRVNYLLKVHISKVIHERVLCVRKRVNVDQTSCIVTVLLTVTVVLSKGKVYGVDTFLFGKNS